MSLSSSRHGILPPWAFVCLVVLAALAVGVGTYALGKGSGEDLAEAQKLGAVEGTAAGQSAGKAQGLHSGLKAGRKAGLRETYPGAYRQAYVEAFTQRGLDAPGNASIKVVEP